MRDFVKRVRRTELPLWVCGMTLSGWLQLILRHGKPRRGKAFFAKATLVSTRNSTQRLKEQLCYSARVKRSDVHPPIFILGFWRSGTTHLHNLFAADDRFAVPNHFEVCNPHTFLSTEERALQRFGKAPLETRLQDNMLAGLFTAAEDEFALAAMTRKSPLLGELYPGAVPRLRKYLSFHDATEGERSEWKEALHFFVRKLTVKYDRPIVLKSPAHTARVRMLIETFPDARFVHISRHPFLIFQSYENMVSKMMGALAEEKKEELRTEAIRGFSEMFRCFFEDRPSILKGRYAEIAFEELEKDPSKTMRLAYDNLDLPDFSYAEKRMAAYLDSISGYRKNQYPQLNSAVAERLHEAWKPYFEEWGYSHDIAIDGAAPQR